ncbi:hypothetical protein CRUP_031255, partial [Coryphaenoides rupestris]
DMLIEVDENGTLDLSMKRCKEQGVKPQPKSSMAKAGGLLINPAFYRSLCERDGWESRVPLNFSNMPLLHDKEPENFDDMTLEEQHYHHHGDGSAAGPKNKLLLRDAKKELMSCPTPGCDGSGHVTGNYASHRSVALRMTVISPPSPSVPPAPPTGSVSGCPLADKTLKSLMAANSQELK